MGVAGGGEGGWGRGGGVGGAVIKVWRSYRASSAKKSPGRLIWRVLNISYLGVV